MKKMKTLKTMLIGLCLALPAHAQKAIETDANAKTFWENLADIPTAPLDAGTQEDLRGVINAEEAGAAAAAQAAAIQRANHTGTQAIATVTGLQSALDARVGKEATKTFYPEDYGASGDAVEISGTRSITSGTATLTVTGASFTAGDVGDIIIVPGAGAAGVPLYTTVSAYTSATQVTLASNASTTLSSSVGKIYLGKNDDTAVQAAITAAQAIPGGTVVISKMHMLSSGVTLAKGWTKIQGFSGGSWFDDGLAPCGFFAGATNTVCIRITGPTSKSARGLILQDFTIAGLRENYNTTTTKGIEAFPGLALYPDGILLRNINAQWLNLGFELNSCDSPRIQGCRICDNNKALLLTGSIGANVVGNFIWDNTTYGLRVESANSYNLNVAGNNFGRNGRDIIHASAEGFTISGNSFHGGNPSPVSAQYGAIQISANRTGFNGTISGNNFYAPAYPDNLQGYQTAAVELTSAQSVAVTGNNFALASTLIPAVKLVAASSCTVAGNAFSHRTRIPVTADASSTLTRIVGNAHNGTITNSGTSLSESVEQPQVIASPIIEAAALPTYADNASALAAEILPGRFYKTSTGELRIVVSADTYEGEAYVARLATYGVTVSGAQKTLILNFIAAEKAAGRWTGLKRFFITGWGNANANALCLKTLSQGVFHGTMTHSTGFSYGDGSTGYFDVGSSGLSLGLGTTDQAMGAVVYIKHSVAAYSSVISQIGATSTDMQLLDTGASNMEWYAPGTGTARTRSNAGGIYLGTRSGTDSKLHLRNNAGFTTSATGTYSAGPGLSSTNFYAWKRGTTSPDLYSNARLGALFFSTGLDDANSSAFTANVETLWEGLFSLTLP